MKANQPAKLLHFLFLSHLSGDEVAASGGQAGIAFLSHLSGDEVPLAITIAKVKFLSHLSGDEVKPPLAYSLK